MTTREYVDRCLEKDFSNKIITNNYEKRLEELLKEDATPLPDEVSFQSQLDEKVYPYLACFRAIRDAGYDEEFGLKYIDRMLNPEG